MQKYISTVRLYAVRDAALNQNLLLLLREKEQALIKQREFLDSSIKKLRHKILFLQKELQRSEDRKSQTEKESSASGASVPLSFVPLFVCPLCGDSLQMEQAAISGCGITHARLSCPCGYEAEIRDGMLFSGRLYAYETDPDFNRCFFGTYRKQSDYDSIIFESATFSSPELMILQHKSFLRLQAMLPKVCSASRMILVPDIACHQLYKLHQEAYLKGAAIVVLAFTPASIVPIQQYLNRLDLDILYVINQDGCLPFRKKSADAIVDYNGMCNFSFFNRTPFPQLFSPYLKDGAELFSASEFYAPQSKTLGIVKKTYKFSNPSVMTWPGMKRCLASCGFELAEQEFLGSCSDPGKFWEYHYPGEQRSCICYHARKLPSQDAVQIVP